MTTELEKQFFDTFGIEHKERYYNCKDNLEGKCGIKCPCECCDKSEEVYYYPQITDKHYLELENILAHDEMDDSGFFGGFHISKYKDGMWKYQLVHRNVGCYTVGVGFTRKEALLKQFIIILKDKLIDKNEKQTIKHQVQAIFEGER